MYTQLLNPGFLLIPTLMFNINKFAVDAKGKEDFPIMRSSL